MNKSLTLSILSFLFISIFIPAKSQSLLWEISGNGLEQSSYLFGTYPLPNERCLMVNDSVLAKIDECEVFATPSLESPEKDRIMDETFSLEEGESLATLFSSAELDTIKYFVEQELKMSFDLIDNMNASPFTIISFGFVPLIKNKYAKTNLDLLSDYATKKNKLKSNFEPLELYLKQFTQQKPDQLLTFIRKYKQVHEIMEQRISAYEKSDINDFVEPYFSHPFFMELFDPFSWERNIVAADSIDALIKRKSTFFVIDAGHLATEKGVIHLLEKKGYQLRPIISQKSSLTEKLRLPLTDDFSQWEKATIKKFNCSIEFPEKPVFNVEEDDNGVTIYSVSVEPEDHINSLYSLQMIKYPYLLIPEDSSGVDEKKLYQFYQTNFVNYIAELGVKENPSPTKITIGQHKGMYVDISLLGGLVKSRLVVLLIRDQQYIFNIISDKNLEDNKELDYFLRSFKLLDNNKEIQEWNLLKSEDGNFSIMMYGKPSFSTIKKKKGSREKITNIYTSSKFDSLKYETSYIIQYSDLRANQRSDAISEKGLIEFYDAILNSYLKDEKEGYIK